MHDFEDNPVIWFAELGRGILLLFIIQVLAGCWTVTVIHSRVPNRYKLPVTLGGVAILSVISSRIFDPKTHIIGCVTGAVAMAFTTPLQAAAWIQRKTSNPSEPTSHSEVILRIAIPAALSSPKRPPEPPAVQILRGIAYLYVGSLTRHWFPDLVNEGGIRLDMLGLVFVLANATGALNFTSALLGFLGIRSPSPFRAPLLSPSMAAFWSGRWNAPVSDALRISVYEPLHKQYGWSRAAASMACFIASGMAHEAVLIYCGVYNSNGEWLCFFMLCGFATLVEKKVHEYMTSSIQKYVFGVTTLSILFHFFFAPVTLRTGFAHAGIRAVGAGPVFVEYLYNNYF